MDTKTYKAPGTSSINADRNRSLPEKLHPGSVQHTYSRPLYFTVTSNVNKSFIVDWQLDDK